MQKTTVYMDEETYRRLKQIARARKRARAAMVREAVAEYTARHAPRRRPHNMGAGRSGRKDLAQRAEALLDGFGEDR
jgi:metal-responsive CopG/Arc/MetJ family transcriptional regulator